MTHATSDIAFTPAGSTVQQRLGSRAGYARRIDELRDLDLIEVSAVCTAAF